jgi:uncharacterized membrane protein (UPF0127 family)
MRLPLASFALFAVVALGAGCLGGSGTDALYPTVEISVADDFVTEELRVEVVHLPLQRQQGLMLRQELGDSAGMLFLFPDDRTGGFWMKDTYLPLDLAFIDADWNVVDVLTGEPLDLTLIVPSGAYRYVLEVNQGWFEEHGISAGAKVTAPLEELPTPE